jgi:polysaccharide export outer membrane protein
MTKMAQMNLLKKLGGGLALALTLCLLNGCGTTNPVARTGTNTPPPPDNHGVALNVGDLVQVTFAGVENPPPQHEERIKDDGTITLPLIGSVVAKGKTTGELQNDIRAQYVPKYFRETLTVTVKAQERSFFVGGEVKNPGRFPWTEGMTVVKAIQTAGYFTDYAKRSKVQLIRSNGKTVNINYDRALEKPELDLPVYPSDSINVPRRGPFS